MKKYILLLSGCFYFLLLSCDGEFEPANFAINLEYPEANSKCEKGEKNGDLITLPFQWKPQGNITDFKLVLNDEVITITPKPVEDDILEFKFDVAYSTEYSWKIISNEANSEVRTFRTPSSLPNDNNVPLAVEFIGDVIYAQQNPGITITLNWVGGQDNDGNLRYDAYWSRSVDISPDNNEGAETNLTNATTSFPIPNFDSNSYYYVLVVARDSENSSSSILKFCQLCTN